MKINLHPFLYFVTPAIGDNVAEWLRVAKEAVIGGVSILQIRDKESSARKLIAAAKELHPFLQERNVALIINDRVDVAHACNADGVHVGMSDLSVLEVRAILGPDAIVGVSLENLDQLKAVEGADYVAASPLYPTLTKKDASSPWGLGGLRALRQATGLPIVAIGGIQVHHIPEILRCGANGVAVVSAIAAAPYPRRAAMQFSESFDRLRSSQLL